MSASVDRTWWPDHISHPRIRLIGAMIAAPILVAVFITLFSAVVFGGGGGPGAPGFDAVDTFLALGVALLVFTWTLGALAIGALWLARLRGFWSWVLVGFAAGIAAAAFVYWRNTFFTGPGIVSIAMFGPTILVLVRALAGVRGDGEQPPAAGAATPAE